MRTPEGREKDKVVEYLRKLGCYYFYAYMGGYGRSGVPDIVACIDGVFWGIEVKAERRLPTKLQTVEMRRITDAGGRTAWGTAKMIIEYIEAWREQG